MALSTGIVRFKTDKGYKKLVAKLPITRLLFKILCPTL